MTELEQLIEARFRDVAYFPVGGFFTTRQTAEFLLELQPMMPRQGRCLDLGCGTKQLWREVLEAYGVEWFGADVFPPTTADPDYRQVIDDQLAFPDGFFDAVCSIDVLEHLTRPDAMMSETARVLKADGVMWGTCAFWQAEHDSYFHMTQRGLRLLLERHGFEILKLTPSRHSGLILASQRLLAGDGRVHTQSFRSTVTSGAKCALNLLPFLICNLLELARRSMRRHDPFADCASLYFVARKVR